MSALSMLQQAVLFLHLIAFAMTLSAVLREDWRLLTTRRIDAPRMISSASWVTASFVGVARLVSPWLSLAGFMALYGAVMSVCLALALAALRGPRVESPCTA
jgi:hypothetical protein